MKPLQIQRRMWPPPNKEENVGGHGILYPHGLKKWGGHVPGALHLIASIHTTNT